MKEKERALDGYYNDFDPHNFRSRSFKAQLLRAYKSRSSYIYRKSYKTFFQSSFVLLRKLSQLGSEEKYNEARKMRSRTNQVLFRDKFLSDGVPC